MRVGAGEKRGQRRGGARNRAHRPVEVEAGGEQPVQKGCRLPVITVEAQVVGSQRVYADEKDAWQPAPIRIGGRARASE